MKKAIAAAGLSVVALAFNAGSAQASDQVKDNQNVLEVDTDQAGTDAGSTDSFTDVRTVDNDSEYYTQAVNDVEKVENKGSKDKESYNPVQTYSEKTEADQGVVSNSGLNVRVGPSVSDEMVGTLDEGAIIRVLERKNGWAKVETADGTGWVSGYYVDGDDKNDNTLQKESTAPITKGDYDYDVKVEKPTNISYDKNSVNGKVVSSTNLNIRTGPGTENSVMGIASKGQSVSIVGEKDGWYEIRLENGQTGWVSGTYITQLGPIKNDEQKTDSNDSTNKDTGKVINTGFLNVRTGPGTNNSKISELDGGDEVIIIDESNGWFKIQLSDGQTGWVSNAYIETNYKSSVNSNDTNKEEENKFTDKPSVTGNKVIDAANNLLGTPYVWGGTSTAGFDCSGFTQYVYKTALGINLPRVSSAQAAGGKAVSAGDYKLGDLVYFATTGTGVTSHVGIYIGDGKFIHASGTPSNPEQVKVDSLGSSYWSKVLLGARRYS